MVIYTVVTIKQFLVVIYSVVKRKQFLVVIGTVVKNKKGFLWFFVPWLK